MKVRIVSRRVCRSSRINLEKFIFNKKSMKNLDKSSLEHYTKLTQKQLEKELLKWDIKSDFSYIGDGLYSYKLGNCSIKKVIDLFLSRLIKR